MCIGLWPEGSAQLGVGRGLDIPVSRGVAPRGDTAPRGNAGRPARGGLGLGVHPTFESCSAMRRESYSAQVIREDQGDLVRRSVRHLVAFQIRCNHSQYGVYETRVGK